MAETYVKIDSKQVDIVNTEVRSVRKTIKELKAMKVQAQAFKQQFDDEITVLNARIAAFQALGVVEDP